MAVALHSGEVVVVGVPAAEGDFDEAHAVLDESAGEEAALSERMAAVLVSEGGTFFGEVEGGEVFALHDADGFVEEGAEVLGIGRGVFAMEALVDGIGEAETSFEIFFADGGMSGGSFQSFFGICDDGGGKFGTHPTCSDHVGGAVDGDVSGEGGVLGTFQSVDPTADGGVDDGSELLVSFMEDVAGLVVVSLLRLHGVDRADFPHDLGGSGEVAGDLESVGGGGDSLDGALDILAGFEVEGVEVAHAAGHVEEDDVGGGSCFWCGCFITEGLGGEGSAQHRGEADAEEFAGGIAEEFATREFVGGVLRGGH